MFKTAGQDMLTRKWIFVREHNQLGDWTLERFMNTCKKLSSTNNSAAIKSHIEGVRKLIQASLRKRKKRKVLSNMPNPI